MSEGIPTMAQQNTQPNSGTVDMQFGKIPQAEVHL